jgi:hypothetical protein
MILNLLNSVGHFFAKVIPGIVKFEKAIAPGIKTVAADLAKVQGTADMVEGLTSVVAGPMAGDITALESAIYGGFGVAHDFLAALGTAADSGSVVTLTVNGTSSTVTVDAGVAQQIIAAGQYIAAHPMGGLPPAGAVKA